jgi:hypothetical protein
MSAETTTFVSNTARKRGGSVANARFHFDGRLQMSRCHRLAKRCDDCADKGLLFLDGHEVL